MCPECLAQGLKSCVRPGVGNTTAMYCPPFYDSDGRMHFHDGNTTTTPYRCSNGHSWTETSSGSCWRGWPKAKTQKAGSGERRDATDATDVHGLSITCTTQ